MIVGDRIMIMAVGEAKLALLALPLFYARRRKSLLVLFIIE